MSRAFLQSLFSSTKRPVLLVSYPKSGSNWVRYCIEYFSGKATPGTKRKLLHPDAEPILDRTHFLEKSDRKLMLRYIEEEQAGNAVSAVPHPTRTLKRQLRRGDILFLRRLLLLLRNPYELYVRVGAKHPLALHGYFTNILLFDQAQRAKQVKYYDDLVANFEEIREILDFLGIENRKFSFDVEEHRQRSLELYKQGKDGPASESSLMNFSYHSDNLKPEIRSEIAVLGKRILGKERFQHYLGRYEFPQKGKEK